MATGVFADLGGEDGLKKFETGSSEQAGKEDQRIMAAGEKFLQLGESALEGLTSLYPEEILPPFDSKQHYSRPFEQLQLSQQEPGNPKDGLENLNNEKTASRPGEPSRLLVLLVLSPDYLVVFAYLTLVWQLHSFYYDGYASLLKLFCKDKGKCNVILISFVLFGTQLAFTILYILRILEVQGLVLLLTWVNFAIPGILVMSIFYLKCKFSGVPKRDEYKSRLRKLNWVVALWSCARLIRAISSLWD